MRGRKAALVFVLPRARDRDPELFARLPDEWFEEEDDKPAAAPPRAAPRPRVLFRDRE